MANSWSETRSLLEIISSPQSYELVVLFGLAAILAWIIVGLFKRPPVYMNVNLSPPAEPATAPPAVEQDTPQRGEDLANIKLLLNRIMEQDAAVTAAPYRVSRLPASRLPFDPDEFGVFRIVGESNSPNDDGTVTYRVTLEAERLLPCGRTCQSAGRSEGCRVDQQASAQADQPADPPPAPSVPIVVNHATPLLSVVAVHAPREVAAHCSHEDNLMNYCLNPQRDCRTKQECARCVQASADGFAAMEKFLETISPPLRLVGVASSDHEASGAAPPADPLSPPAAVQQAQDRLYNWLDFLDQLITVEFRVATRDAAPGATDQPAQWHAEERKGDPARTMSEQMERTARQMEDDLPQEELARNGTVDCL